MRWPPHERLRAQRNSDQKLGVATFNKAVTTILPFTSDQAEIDKALARRPATSYGTVVYDAVTFAVDQIKKSGATSGTIVLLADGQNVGSLTSLTDAIDRLRTADVRLFSVGLRSPAYYAPPLRRLARTSHGTYAEAASSKGLEAIYNALGARLANEYSLSYRSLAGPGQKVFVSVKVPGSAGAAVASYISPGPASGPRRPPVVVGPVHPVHGRGLARDRPRRPVLRPVGLPDPAPARPALRAEAVAFRLALAGGRGPAPEHPYHRRSR